ncbi:MAG: M48 family metalloprotease, partial [Dehalococcoidales bacterium]|nr:M48 family metalloprotease [Dehalococcoidales bacterium]
MKISLDPVRQEKARKYASARRRLGAIGTTIDLALLFLLLCSGISVRVRDMIALPVIPAAVLYFAILLIVYSILSLPLGYYQGYILPHRYGLSTQSLRNWVSDELKSTLLSLGLGAVVVAVLYLFLTMFPSIWWLFSWAGALIFTVLMANLAPVLIIPLFLKMRPLEDTALKSRLEKLARRSGIRVAGVYVIEFSARGTTANAALMGLGNTRRIVLSDTLLRQYPPTEIEVITAHEIGHQVNSDTCRLLVMQSVAMLI